MIVPGVAATTGVLEYEEPDGSIRRELVTADALEDPSSLIGKPVTLEHPPEGEVNPRNFKEHVVGEVVDARFDAQSGQLRVKLRVKDAEAIRAVRSGTKELSPGYTATIVDESGTHPEHGEYDLKQTDRQNNHLAITEAGRDGPESSIRLDSAGNVVLDSNQSDQPMKEENESEENDGQRVDSLEDRIDQMAAQVTALTQTVQALANGQRTDEDDEDDESNSEQSESGSDEDEDKREDSNMDKQERIEWFRERRDALDTADRLDVEVEDDATVPEIKRAVVEDQRGDLRNDSEEYVAAAFDLITDELDESEETREDSETEPDPFDDEFGESFMPEDPEAKRQDSEETREDGGFGGGLRPGEEPAQQDLREQLSGAGD